jgi:hypothetical protein
MPLTIVKGPSSADENCLHCVLAPIISDFIDAHPEYKSGDKLVRDVAKLLGEFIGSGLYNSGTRLRLTHYVEMASLEARRSATELLHVMDKEHTS